MQALDAKTKPTRADFERLSADHARLRADVDALRAQFRQLAEELHTQFIRIAQMQAILDEQRIADAQQTTPPLLQQLPRS